VDRVECRLGLDGRTGNDLLLLRRGGNGRQMLAPLGLHLLPLQIGCLLLQQRPN